jgi:putative ABC transport system permease protein
MLKAILVGLYRDKLYTLVNIVGLSLAFASCLVLGLYLRSELTYDQHHENHERIYRVATQFTVNGRPERLAMSPSLLAPMLAEDVADFRAFVRLRPPGYWETGSDRLIRHGDDAFYWSRAYVADPNVFAVFTHDILYGDPDTALVEPQSIAVSRTFAQRYFGVANPLGEIVTLDNGSAYEIALVFADLPDNTHLKYDVLFSYSSVVQPASAEERIRDLFGATDYTYLVLRDGYDPGRFPALADEFFARHMTRRAAEIHVDGWTAWLQPLADIHFGAGLNLDQSTSNRNYLLGLEATVAFLLLIACINHINLGVAGAVRRAREIATRKILGATRGALVLRFVCESLLVGCAALVLSVLVVELVVPLTPIAQWLDSQAILDPLREPAVLLAISAVALAVGALAGVYPAVHLAGTPALAAMSGRNARGAGLRVRELLVVAQFAATACVIACTLLMAAQMRYVASTPLGFDKDSRIMVTVRGADVLAQLPAIERELSAHALVRGVTSSDTMLGLDLPAGFMDVETNDGSMNGVLVNHLPVADNFIDVLGIELVTGRDFAPEAESDVREAIIVNEALVRLMGWKEPIGKRMGIRGRHVIGVVRDFNFKSLHTPVEPIVMYQNRNNRFANLQPDQRPFKQQFLVLAIATTHVGETLESVRSTLARFDPAHPLDYRFIDDALGARYLSEERLMRLIALFSAVCMLVACLGLFALAAFTAAQRTKEIGIRKVLGASTAQILFLLSWRTLKLVVIGSAVAAVLAYAAMERWLAEFAYRIDVGVSPFVLAGLIVTTVALATVWLQSLDAASARPVRALRD